MSEAVAGSSTTTYRSLYSPACTGCASYANRLDAVFAEGRSLDSVTRLESLRVRPLTGPDRAAADMRLAVPAYAVLSPDGAVVEDYEASEGELTVALVRRADRSWAVERVTRRTGG